ncbi:unnamed protein product, partial [Mesorhabditis belari]|uniref:Carboxylesterase type B domain-containing protein n=1 Tax=Mesorhabditis belari TaxID=2138241 RepID=A0AAF3EI30_9BILA
MVAERLGGYRPVPHTEDLLFIWFIWADPEYDDIYDKNQTTDFDFKLADTYAIWWTNFAKYGKPTMDNSWKPVALGSEKLQHFRIGQPENGGMKMEDGYHDLDYQIFQQELQKKCGTTTESSTASTLPDATTKSSTASTLQYASVYKLVMTISPPLFGEYYDQVADDPPYLPSDDVISTTSTERHRIEELELATVAAFQAQANLEHQIEIEAWRRAKLEHFQKVNANSMQIQSNMYDRIQMRSIVEMYPQAIPAQNQHLNKQIGLLKFLIGIGVLLLLMIVILVIVLICFHG